MTKFRVTLKKNGIISLEVEPAPRDPPSLEGKEKKRYLKQEISKNPKLESFLKGNKVYGRFISNYIKQNDIYNVDRFKENIKKELNTPDPIDSSLIWTKTREGYSFWARLDVKY